MHYKNGREAKLGDTVVCKGYAGPYTGVIISITPGPTTCNAQIVPLPNTNSLPVTLGEVLHTEDAVQGL